MQLITHPLTFFRALIGKPIAWRVPIAVMASYAGLASIGTGMMYVRMNHAVQNVPEGGAVAFIFPLLLATAMQFVSVATMFVIATLALVALDRVFARSGRARWLFSLRTSVSGSNHTLTIPSATIAHSSCGRCA